MLLHSTKQCFCIRTHLLISWRHLSPLTAMAVGTPNGQSAHAGRDGQIAPQRKDVAGTDELWRHAAKHC